MGSPAFSSQSCLITVTQLYAFGLVAVRKYLSKHVYPAVAEKYNKNANTIKCDISQATKMMIYDCDEDVITNYFNLTNFVKPTVKQVIFTVLNKL